MTIGGPQGLSVDLNRTPETAQALEAEMVARSTIEVRVEARRERCRADWGAALMALAETGRSRLREMAVLADILAS